MITWKDFEQLCKDIEQNPDKYNWIIFDPLFGITIKNEKGTYIIQENNHLKD